MIACAIISGANPIPSAIADRRSQRDCRSSLRGPRANVDNPRRMPARSRAPANEKPAASFPARALKFLRCCRCTGDLPDVSNYFQAGQRAIAVRFKKPATVFPARALKFLRRWEYARDLPDVSNYFLEFPKKVQPGARVNASLITSRRRIHRLSGFWPWRVRLKRRLRRGRSYRGAHGVGRGASRCIDLFRTRRVWLVPGAVIDHQQRNQAEDRNNDCARDRSGSSLWVISIHRRCPSIEIGVALISGPTDKSHSAG
jgi:hypothetical protein